MFSQSDQKLKFLRRGDHMDRQMRGIVQFQRRRKAIFLLLEQRKSLFGKKPSPESIFGRKNPSLSFSLDREAYKSAQRSFIEGSKWLSPQVSNWVDPEAPLDVSELEALGALAHSISEWDPFTRPDKLVVPTLKSMYEFITREQIFPVPIEDIKNTFRRTGLGPELFGDPIQIGDWFSCSAAEYFTPLIVMPGEA